MASSYSTDLKLELMVTGENAGTWGDNTNNNLNLIQQAIAGYEAVALTDGGTVALAMTDKTISNARNMVLKFTGTLTTASIVTIPDSIEKFYIFDCSAVVGPTNLTIKTASGTGFTLNAAKIFAAYSDGTNLNEISLDTLGGTIAFADVTGTVSTAQIADNAVTTAKISDNQITTAKISDNQITTAKISDNQITTAKIANDAVGPDQLSDTAVTPGSYTATSLTVDAQGRITAASSGSAGSLGFYPSFTSTGAGSGTYSSSANANGFLAYVTAGGGGGTQSGPTPRYGGDGGYGAFVETFTHPFTAPYSIGSGGGRGATQGNVGNPGNASNFHTYTMNAGNGAPNGSPGTNGTAPGAYQDLTPNYPTRNRIDAVPFGNYTPSAGPQKAGNVRYWGGGGDATGNSPADDGTPGAITVYESISV